MALALEEEEHTIYQMELPLKYVNCVSLHAKKK